MNYISPRVNPTGALLSLLLIGLGSLALAFPMRIRSIVAPKTWRDDPERAELYQRVFASAVGLAIVALGVALLVWSLVA